MVCLHLVPFKDRQRSPILESKGCRCLFAECCSTTARTQKRFNASHQTLRYTPNRALDVKQSVKRSDKCQNYTRQPERWMSHRTKTSTRAMDVTQNEDVNQSDRCHTERRRQPERWISHRTKTSTRAMDVTQTEDVKQSDGCHTERRRQPERWMSHRTKTSNRATDVKESDRRQTNRQLVT